MIARIHLQMADNYDQLARQDAGSPELRIVSDEGRPSNSTLFAD